MYMDHYTDHLLMKERIEAFLKEAEQANFARESIAPSHSFAQTVARVLSAVARLSGVATIPQVATSDRAANRVSA